MEHHSLNPAALEARYWSALSTTDLGHIFERLKSWLTQHLPEIVASLNPPASEAQITSFEASIGQRLPGDVRRLYSLHNGQQDRLEVGLYWGMVFMPLELSLGHWKMWASVMDSFSQADMDSAKPFGSYPKGMIEPVYASKHWIPLLSDGTSNGLAVDLKPGPKGVVGQVISYGRDENEHYVVAPSITHLFDALLTQLELGEYSLIRQTFAPRTPTLLQGLHWQLAYLRKC